MEIREYQKESYTSLPPHVNSKEAISEWLIGLTEEVGEVASLVKHYFYKGEGEAPIETLAEELGDVLWYVSAICSEMKIDLNVVANLNLAKLQNRYEGEYSDEKARKRKANFQAFKSTEIYHMLIGKLKIRE